MGIKRIIRIKIQNKIRINKNITKIKIKSNKIKWI